MRLSHFRPEKAPLKLLGSRGFLSQNRVASNSRRKAGFEKSKPAKTAGRSVLFGFLKSQFLTLAVLFFFFLKRSGAESWVLVLSKSAYAPLKLLESTRWFLSELLPPLKCVAEVLHRSFLSRRKKLARQSQNRPKMRFLNRADGRCFFNVKNQPKPACGVPFFA